MTLKQRKRRTKIKKFIKDVRVFIAVIYGVLNAGQAVWGTMDERWKETEKAFKRIEYAFPGYRIGRRIEREVDPLIDYLFGGKDE